MKFFGKREQFLQQTVARKRTRRIRQHEIIGAEAERCHTLRTQQYRRLRRPFGISHHHLRHTVQQQFIQRVDDIRVARNV